MRASPETEGAADPVSKRIRSASALVRGQLAQGLSVLHEAPARHDDLVIVVGVRCAIRGRILNRLLVRRDHVADACHERVFFG